MSTLRPEEYLLVEFNNFPIVEYGSNTNLSYDGDGDIELLPGVHDKSLLMSKSGSFRLTADSRYSNFRKEFSVGFWLNSVSLSDKIIGENIYSAVMPLVSIGQATLLEGEYDLRAGLFCISEKCVFKNFNQLVFTILGSSGSKHEYESELYEAGIFNHFLLSVNSETKVIELYINGVESILTATVNGEVPVILGTPGSSDFLINHSIVGDQNNFERNSGLIDDLFVISQAVTENYKISKIISDGFASYIKETSGNISEYIFEAKISFSQKTNITPPVTAVDSTTGDIIAGTQDGLVLKGDSGYWNKKYVLSRSSDLNDLKISYAYQSGSSSSSGFDDGKIDPGSGLVLINNGLIIG